MVKKININASYNNKAHIFECDEHNFLEKAAEYFGIDIRDVELYSGKKGGLQRKIGPHDITDLMVVEIVDKKKSNEKMCNERSLSINTIITKLKNNSPLTGLERKSMVEWLEIYSSDISRKRKLDNGGSKPNVAHKKVQINFQLSNCKESFAQTDLVNEAPAEVQKRDEQISNKIKRLAVNSEVDIAEVTKLMNESFDDRRNFIFLKVPPVVAVKDKYPLLFSLQEVKNELGRIFYAEKCEEFIKNMHKYAECILQMPNSTDEMVIRTNKAVSRYHTDKQKAYAKAVGSVFVLTQVLKEKWNFIHLQDFPHGSDDIYPHIDASCYSLKEIFFDNCVFRIIVEGQLLCEATNFLEAVLCLLGSFFIFNIDYPESCQSTLIVFEKIYLDANDTKDLKDFTIQIIKLLKLQVSRK